MVSVIAKYMPAVEVLRFVYCDVTSLTAGGEQFTVMGELHKPDLSSVPFEFAYSLERKLTPVTDVVCEQGRRFVRVVIETFRYLILLDLA